MVWTILYGNFFMICFVIKLGWSRGVQVTELNVPSLIDPRDELILGCRYDMGSEELYSVKWYKDEQEFFRYTPRQQPHIMFFPVAGVHLIPGGSMCNIDKCTIRLSDLNTAHSSGSYRCEVSTEAPAFRVAFSAGNVTVAVVGRHEPRIEGFRDVYSLADFIHVNCTAAPADPAPIITWLLNGQPAQISQTGPLRNSPPDSRGLITANRDLRFHAERRHFSSPERTMKLQCVAAPPIGVSVPTLTATLTARLHDPQANNTAPQQRNVLGNQKFAWPSSTDKIYKLSIWMSTIAVCLLLI